MMTTSVGTAYGGFACPMRRAEQFAGFSLHLKIVKFMFVIFYEQRKERIFILRTDCGKPGSGRKCGKRFLSAWNGKGNNHFHIFVKNENNFQKLKDDVKINENFHER